MPENSWFAPPFCAKQVNQCPHHGEQVFYRFFTEQVFYRISPSGCFWILRLFSFRIEEARRAFEEENEFLQRDIKENCNNLVQNQKQVTVSSIASVMKTSTSSVMKTSISKPNIEQKQQQWQKRMILQWHHWINCCLGRLV